MSHIGVLTIPATGHTLPALDVVTELRSRGHRVTHLTTAAFAPAARAAGAEVVTYDSTLVARPAGPVSAQDFAMWLPFVLVNEATSVLPQILDAIGHDVPDVLLYDRAAYPTGRALAQMWDRPAIVLYGTFAQGPAWSLAEATGQRSVLDVTHPAYAPLQERLDDFTGAWRLDRMDVQELARATERRSIAFLPRQFQWNGAAFGPDHHFVGPCLRSRLPKSSSSSSSSSSSEGLVYVCAGTTATSPAALGQLARAVAEAVPGRRVLLSTGGLPVDELGPLPPQVQVEAHVDQLAVLARADAFVTHAGMGSVMEALWFAVPMLCVPASGEQQLAAARLEALGLGRCLPADAGTGPVAEALRMLLDDRGTSARLQEMARIVRSAGGAVAAADVTEAASTASSAPGGPAPR